MRTSVPLRFCLLVLPGWSGMNVFPVIEMGVWVFGPLCWPFLHTVPDFVYFWILRFLNPKAKWVLISKFFQNLGFLPRFACRTIFSGFLGTMWVMDLDDPFGYQSDHYCTCMLHLYVALGCVSLPYSRLCVRLSDFYYLLFGLF